MSGEKATERFAEEVEHELAEHRDTIGKAAIYIAEHLAGAPLLPHLRTEGHELAHALARIAGVESDVERLIPHERGKS